MVHLKVNTPNSFLPAVFQRPLSINVTVHIIGEKVQKRRLKPAATVYVLIQKKGNRKVAAHLSVNKR